MKTLDEVIKANECCDHGEPDSKCEDCPYNGIGACCAERETDALHYLKVLKDILDPLKVKKNSCKITCPQCNSVIAILLPESNEPLTWDELQLMEGKPVWIEGPFITEGPHWIIVGPSHLYDGKIVGYGKTWQAYRKEQK